MTNQSPAVDAVRPDDAFERALRLVYAYAEECVADGHVSTFTEGHVHMVNAITAIERESLAALHPQPAPAVAVEAKRLGYELDGVIIDTEEGRGFDEVCLRTVKRVRQALAALAARPSPPTMLNGLTEAEMAPLTQIAEFERRVIDLQERAFMPYGQALELAASEFGDIVCWVHEWGAIGLPLGHPSRVTCFLAFNTLAEAIANAEGCEFNDRILPVFQPVFYDTGEFPAPRSGLNVPPTVGSGSATEGKANG
jgi:hypothetical protein